MGLWWADDPYQILASGRETNSRSNVSDIAPLMSGNGIKSDAVDGHGGGIHVPYAECYEQTLLLLPSSPAFCRCIHNIVWMEQKPIWSHHLIWKRLCWGDLFDVGGGLFDVCLMGSEERRWSHGVLAHRGRRRFVTITWAGQRGAAYRVRRERREKGVWGSRGLLVLVRDVTGSSAYLCYQPIERTVMNHCRQEKRAFPTTSLGLSGVVLVHITDITQRSLGHFMFCAWGWTLDPFNKSPLHTRNLET